MSASDHIFETVTNSPWIRGAPHSGFSLLIRRNRIPLFAVNPRACRLTVPPWLNEDI